MGKIHKKVRRADADTMADHVHELPNGELTGGSLHKPSKDQYDMHAHLYESEEDTSETGIMHNEGDHTHTIIFEGHKVETSGPKPVPKKPGESWKKMDSVQLEGEHYVVRSSTGQALKRSRSKADCEKFIKDTNGSRK